jgi:ATP-binding cassette, subfamily C, bacterial CydCD
MKLNPRLLKEARQSQIAFILSICFGLMAGILSIFQARGISRLIGQVFLQGKDLATVSRILITIFIIMLLRAGLSWGGDWFSFAGARRIKQNLRQRLYTHITDIGPAYLRSEAGESEVRTGELINVATEGIDALESYYSQYLPQIALSALIPLSILVFVFPTDFLSGMILLVTAPLLPLFMYLIGSVAETLTRKQWKGLSRMSAYFLDVLQGLTTLKSFGRSKDQEQVINKISEQYRQSTMGVLKVTFLSALVLELIATLSTAVVAVEIGIRLLYGKVVFEQAFFVLLLAPEFYQPLRLLGTRFHASMGGIEASKRIFEILDLPVTKDASSSITKILPSPKDNPLPSIVFNDVSYVYSDNRPALKGVTFEIPAGKMTALVGESGAGKTSLTWLLLGFLRPKSGGIFVNGVNLSEIPAQQWRDILAWVPQNPYLFNDTITANIKIARPEATEAEIQLAARMAHADEFIVQLPQGYGTMVGERGTRLSSGQAQRVALARAFLKNAPFLILDEATSHLDPEMDTLLQESLVLLSHSRTVLVIAHHQSTLAKADQVIRLSRGMVDHTYEITQTTTPLQGGAQSTLQTSTTQTQTEDPGLLGEHEQLHLKKTHTKSVEPRLIKLLSPFAGRILLSIFLGFATIASGIGLMATAAYIISSAALHPSIAELQVAIVGVRFFGLSRGVFRYLERLVSHDVTFRLLARWRVWFYQALEPLAPARLMQYHSGDLLSRVIGDIGTLEGFYVRAIAPPLVAILVAIDMGVFFRAFGSEFTWVLITFLIIAGLGLPLLISFLSHHWGQQIVQARADLSKEIIDGIQGLPDLLTCGQSKAQILRVDRAGKRLSGLQSRTAGISAMQSAVVSLLSNLCMLTILIFAIQSVSQGQLDGVLLGVLALGALMSFEAVQPLPVAAQNLEANRAAARRLYELVDATPIVNDPLEPLLLPEDNHLSVKELSFQYPTQVSEGLPSENSDFGLENISFFMPQGKHIAIVGPSGAGKTTLINLLQRFWEYQNGSVQLSGNELHQYSQEAFRRRIAVVPQSTYLFSTTIKQNLLIARPEASDDDIIHATQAAHLHDTIQTFPDGYDTWVGEHGLRLSAGERQRLAIARALLKDAPLLILDEPSSNLDSVTEAQVLNSIRKLSLGHSMITITQRFVGLEAMDEILVFKDGHLIEHGAHKDLLSKQGLYCQMWTLYNQII